jgi:hypothetical protein
MIKGRAHDMPSRSALILLLGGANVLFVGCASLIESGAATLHCPDSVQTKVSAAQPTVHVSYTEPSLSVDGSSLTDLSKTSIYYDLGDGRTLAKEVPATRSSGAGEISETITVPVKSEDTQSVKICVTATDRNGNESMMTP